MIDLSASAIWVGLDKRLHIGLRNEKIQEDVAFYKAVMKSCRSLLRCANRANRS